MTGGHRQSLQATASASNSHILQNKVDKKVEKGLVDVLERKY